jgi:hypothetical protein
MKIIYIIYYIKLELNWIHLMEIKNFLSRNDISSILEDFKSDEEEKTKEVQNSIKDITYNLVD